MPAGFPRVIPVAALTAVLPLPLAAAQSSNPTRPASRVAQEPHPQIMAAIRALDRKSTRLNSSHSQISYAVFCLKKKKVNKDVRLDLLAMKHKKRHLVLRWLARET